jgi:hypothetical protein
MNRFAWGNMNSKHIFIDDNLQRTTEIVQLKPTFIRLAETLFSEGKTEKAVKVLDHLQEILPLGMYNTGLNDAYVASLYYQLNQKEKGDNTIRTLTDEVFEKADFYLSLGSRYKQSAQREMASLQRILSIAIKTAQYGNESLATELENKMRSYPFEPAS